MITWEESATIARRIFGDQAVLPLNGLHEFAKAIRNETLEEAAQKAFGWNTAMTDTLANEIRELKEQQ